MNTSKEQALQVTGRDVPKMHTQGLPYFSIHKIKAVLRYSIIILPSSG
jgi:hypothetical protein